MFHYKFIYFGQKLPVDWFLSRRLLWRCPSIVLVLFLHAPVWRKLLIFRIPFDTFVYQLFRKFYMFKDSKYIFDSVIHPHAKLNKIHNELSFHRVWDDIAYNIVTFYHVSWGHNPANILSKHFSLFHPLIFFMGGTMDLLDLKLRGDGSQENFRVRNQYGFHVYIFLCFSLRIYDQNKNIRMACGFF